MDDELKNIKKRYIEGLNARLKHDLSDEEIWVVQEFFKKHGINFNEEDIIKEPQQSKIDISFKDCSFQLKKIRYPEDYKIKDEDQKFKNRITNAMTQDEFVNATVIKSGFEGEYLEPKYLSEKIIQKSFELANRKRKEILQYPSEIREKLDLLFYIEVDLANAKQRPQGIIYDKKISEQLKDAGWRSISYLYGSLSLILYVSENAPNILKSTYSKQI